MYVFGKLRRLCVSKRDLVSCLVARDLFFGLILVNSKIITLLCVSFTPDVGDLLERAKIKMDEARLHIKNLLAENASYRESLAKYIESVSKVYLPTTT